MNSRTYFRGQIKRIVRLFPGIFALSLVFALVIGVAGVMNARHTNYNKAISKYNIGILCDKENVMLSMGLELVQSIDDIQFIINIYQYESEEEGFAALHSNEIKVLVVVPDGFVDAFMSKDESVHIKLYAASQKGITTVVMDEMVDIVAGDVIYTEAGLYSLQEELEKAGANEELKKELNDKLTLKYMNSLISRGLLTEITQIGLGDGLSFLGFFFCGIVLFYTAMLSFCSISFFLGSRTEFFMIARSRGVKPFAQVMSEFTCFTVSNFICAVFVLIGVYILFASNLFMIEEFSHSFTSRYIRFALFYVLTLIGLSAFQFFLFEVMKGIINKFLLPFLVLLGFSFLSGYFYPRTFLPEIACTIGENLPTGVAYNVLSAGITGAHDYVSLIKLFLYTAAFLAVSVYVRKVHIERGID